MRSQQVRGGRSVRVAFLLTTFGGGWILAAQRLHGVECRPSSSSSSDHASYYPASYHSQQQQQQQQQQSRYSSSYSDTTTTEDDDSRKQPRSQPSDKSDDDDDDYQNQQAAGYTHEPFQQESEQHFQQQQQQQQQPQRDASFSARRPPPPPPDNRVVVTNPNPIHYNFQSRSAVLEQQQQRREKQGTFDDETSEAAAPPQTFHAAAEEEATTKEEDVDYRNLPRYSSARTDPVTRFMSNSKGRTLLWFSSGTVGAALGAAIGHSLQLHRPKAAAMTGAVVWGTLFWWRNHNNNAYVELVRALGLTLIWAVQRSRSVRRRYPTHLAAALGLAPRRPFPPLARDDDSDNLWNYSNKLDDSGSMAEQFNMLYSVLALALVGCVCGGNLPLLPTWLGALAGAGVLATAATLPNARGDLVRTMGMRVVAMAGVVVNINRELQLLRKMGTVSGLVLDKILILDRQHRIKDRILAGASFLYEQALRTTTTTKVPQQRRDDEYHEEEEDRRRGRPGERPSRPQDGPRDRGGEYQDGRGDSRGRDDYRDQWGGGRDRGDFRDERSESRDRSYFREDRDDDRGQFEDGRNSPSSSRWRRGRR